ncbi:MAG TPA: arsenate reductase ArsC [Anaerolineaceae bacterium]|nr:arsenate reductase ArsC [Anaerolineaceae bacterium]
MEKQRVLFLCTGNTARSQMAEAILRRAAGGRFEVFSAGLDPGTINPDTIAVMEAAGYDLSGQYSKGLDEYLGKQSFDYLITVCSDAEDRCPFFPGAGKRLHWPFDDPAKFDGTHAEKLAEFRRVRDQIEAKINGWLEGR